MATKAKSKKTKAKSKELPEIYFSITVVVEKPGPYSRDTSLIETQVRAPAVMDAENPEELSDQAQFLLDNIEELELRQMNKGKKRFFLENSNDKYPLPDYMKGDLNTETLL